MQPIIVVSGDTEISLPTDKCGTLKLETLLSIFPECSGLAYEHDDCDTSANFPKWKLVEKRNENLLPPVSGWGTKKYYCITGKKVKIILKDLNKTWTEKLCVAYLQRYGITQEVDMKKNDKTGYVVMRFISNKHLEEMKQEKLPFTVEVVDHPDSKKFLKRPGTTNMGREFEELTIASLLLNLTLNDKVQDFSLSANDKDFGNFDDVVVDIELTDGRHFKYAMQMKYNNENGHFTKNYLINSKSPFSLQRFFKDHLDMIEFTKSYNLVFCTNLKFKTTDKEEELKLENGSIKLKTVRENNLLQFFGDGTAFKFLVNSDDQKLLEQCKLFFEQFILFTNRPTINGLKSCLFDTFSKELSCESSFVVEKYTSFISEWCVKIGFKNKLHKGFIKEIISVQLLTASIIPYPPLTVPENEKMKLFKEAVERFNVTVVKEESLPRIQQIWGNETGEEVQIRKIINQRQLKDLNKNQQRTVALWIMNKCPLIVTKSDTAQKIFALCWEKKFVLLEPQETTQLDIPDLKVFYSLADVKKYNFDVYNEIIKNFDVSLQGKKEIHLEHLIARCEGIENIITCNELLQMLNDPFSVGKRETLLENYIDRRISRFVITDEFFNRADTDILIVISCEGQSFAKEFKNFNIIHINKQSQGLQIEDLGQKTMYVFDEHCDRDTFETICNKNSKKKEIHHLKVIENENLEWICSFGEIHHLQKYISNSHFVKESDLVDHELENEVNVITAGPGMGKTESMKTLVKNYTPSFWTVLISAKDWSECLNEENSDEKFFDCVLDKTCKTTFERKLLKVLANMKMVTYFWDGLDELPDKKLMAAIEVIKCFSNKGFKQWISCRNRLKSKIQKNFNVLARTIAPFNEADQKNYIRKRLGDQNINLEEVITKIQKYIKNVESNHLLGIPLQIYMLTALFSKNPKKIQILLNGIFSIAYLYKDFFQMKFDIYVKEKIRLNEFNSAVQHAIDFLREEQLKYLQKAALLTTIENEFLKDLNIDLNVSSIVEQVSNDIGIITGKTKEGKPLFVHYSYAEYFAALYLYKHREGLSKRPILKKIIFHERYRNIRFMFDLLLAKHSPPHLAVLYKNMEYLESCEDYSSKDKGGRNLLQIACSWGTTFPRLKFVEENQKIVDNSQAKLVDLSNVDHYDDILLFLLKYNSIEERDSLFGMNALEYADITLSLKALFIFSDNAKFISEKLVNLDTPTILYYSAYLDHTTFLEKINDIPNLKTKTYGFTMLHVATMKNAVKCLKFLLTKNAFLDEIDDTQNEFQDTCVYLASAKGYAEALKILIDSGADVNIPDRTGYSPIHMAVQNQHHNLVTMLIASGCNVNAKTEKNVTPLHLACVNGCCIVIRQLIEAGADVNISQQDDFFPIHIAAQNGHSEAVKMLIEYQVDVNSKTKNGFTPIYLASENGHCDVVNLLLGSKADVNISQQNGVVPLHVASWKGHIEVVRLLIERAGCDVNIRTPTHSTPIYLAAHEGHYEVVNFLVDSGADVNIPQKCGYLPIDAAAENGHHKVVGLLGRDINIRYKNGCNKDKREHTACKTGLISDRISSMSEHIEMFNPWSSKKKFQN